MIIKTICGSGLGTSLLVEMNVKEVLKKLNIKNASVEHTNISAFTKHGVDYVICGLDIAPSIDFPEDKMLKLKNILSIEELEVGIKKLLKIN